MTKVTRYVNANRGRTSTPGSRKPLYQELEIDNSSSNYSNKSTGKLNLILDNINIYTHLKQTRIKSYNKSVKLMKIIDNYGKYILDVFSEQIKIHYNKNEYYKDLINIREFIKRKLKTQKNSLSLKNTSIFKIMRFSM